MTISRERIAAYADGELDADAASEVERAVAADPELQRQVEAHRQLKARLSTYFAPLMAQPVPKRLTVPLRIAERPNQAVDFANAVRRREERISWKQRWSRVAGPALAASLILAVMGLGAGWGMFGHSRKGYADGNLASALDEQLVATQPTDPPVRILLSFRNRGGRFCRGFTTASNSGVACHDEYGWRLRQLNTGKAATSGEYRQASSPEAQVMAAIQDMAQGPALDAEGERTAMRAGWVTRNLDGESR